MSLEFSQKDIKDLKPCSSRLHEVEEEIEKMCGSLDYHTDKIEYLENQSRRSNIRIDGIREEEAETWDNTETKVKEILKEKLNLDEEPDIERAHRVGRRANATTGSVRRPRTIVCRLRDWKKKEQIIRSARRIKPPGIFVNEDLAQGTLDNREEQRPKFEVSLCLEEPDFICLLLWGDCVPCLCMLHNPWQGSATPGCTLPHSKA